MERIQILLAFADEQERRRFKTTFAHNGYTICGEVESGEELVRLVALQEPELVVMDPCLREVDGLEALLRLKGKPFRTKYFVIGAVSDGVLRRALECGADAVAVLPCEEKFLLRQVKELLSAD